MAVWRKGRVMSAPQYTPERPMYGLGYFGFARLYFGAWMVVAPPVLLVVLLLAMVFDPHGRYYGAGAIACVPVFLVGLLLVRSVPECE